MKKECKSSNPSKVADDTKTKDARDPVRKFILSFPFLSFPFLSFPFLSFPFLSFPSFSPSLNFILAEDSGKILYVNIFPIDIRTDLFFESGKNYFKSEQKLRNKKAIFPVVGNKMVEGDVVGI